MTGEWVCGGNRQRALRATLEVHQLEPTQIGWHLTAESDTDRLLISGVAVPITADVPQALTPTFVDAPNPLLLDGERGALTVLGGRLWLASHDGRSHVEGRIECTWRSAATGRARPCELWLKFEVAVQFG